MPDREPPVTEALMALFASAAPLIEKARASGLFRDRPIDVTPAPPPPPPPPPEPAAAPAGDAAKLAALHDIIVAQAQKIVALEAEVARLKG
ncbi:MAG: hypothetical protein JO290_10045 [Sphingomonadaceae bacterium]|nr:hypothetical protein [Sphingomonadaceae bacterium]